VKLSNQDCSFFFESHHHELGTHLGAIAQQLLAEETFTHDTEYIAEMGRRLGDSLGLYPWLTPDDGQVDTRALCLIRECLGYASPLADAIFAVQGLSGFPVLSAGTTDEHKSLLVDMQKGDAVGGFALTEPGAGSDVAAIAMSARRDGDSYVLDGEKTYISNVGIAAFYVVFARTDPDAGHRGLTAFVVPNDTAGLTTEPIPMSIDHPIGKLHLQGVRVPVSSRLGNEGEGFKLAMKTLDTFRVSVGAAAVGMARRALDEAIGHVRQRVQFGKPLAEQQMIQGYLADMATELDASRLLVLRAAHAKDTRQNRVSMEVGMAKMYATEAAQTIIDKAVQLFGGLGVTRGLVVERLYREIRPLRIYEGTTEIQRLIISRGLLRDGDSNA
jgi:acyl-CoA dehydrogenase